MNNAQQVRIWAGVGVGFLAVIGVFCMVGSLVVVGHSIYASNDGGFYAWFFFTLIMFVTLGVLAGFTIFRFYNPIGVTK